MEASTDNKLKETFRFESTKNKLGVRIWGDRLSLHQLHELLSECLDGEDAEISISKGCSYLCTISYFSYEVRHAFMSDRLVLLDGKPVKEWPDEMFDLFEKETERFQVGFDMTWPHMFFIMEALWECQRHKDCPARLNGILREFTQFMEQLLLLRGKNHYARLEPFLHGAIYAANPYFMYFMEHVNRLYLFDAHIFGKVSTMKFHEDMEYAVFGSNRYNDFMYILKKNAKKLGCKIEDLDFRYDDPLYDIEL